MARPPPHQDPVFQEQFQIVEERFRLMFSDTAEVRSIIDKGLRFSRPTQNIENKLNLFERNFFSEELLQALICGGSQYKLSPISYIWQRLVDNRIMLKSTGHFPGILVDHQMDIVALLRHLEDNTFANLFAPPSNLLSRYGGAIVAVDVTTAPGDLHRASAFIVQLQPHGSIYLVTCKHNVDPAEGIVVNALTTADGESLFVEQFVLSEAHDIAFARLRVEPDEPVFRFAEIPQVFDEVYTVGFPHVPRAQPVLLGHRGEVNGIADLYREACSVIVISNLVSPGSSGCPVLAADGHCVGMTIQWLEEKWGEESEERMRFSVALTPDLIKSFLKGEVK